MKKLIIKMGANHCVSESLLGVHKAEAMNVLVLKKI